MRDRSLYRIAVAVLIMAIFALVLVFGQDQSVVSLQESPGQTQGNSMQTLFIALAGRVNSDAGYAFLVRVIALADGQALTVSQTGTRITEIGSDYFCLSNEQDSRVCYPYAQVIAARPRTSR